MGALGVWVHNQNCLGEAVLSDRVPVPGEGDFVGPLAPLFESHSSALIEQLKQDLRAVAKPSYSVVLKKDGSIRYTYGSTTKGHGIDAQLSSDGILEMEIQAQNRNLRPHYGSGTDMYNEMMSVLGPENIKEIHDTYPRSSGLATNLDQFNEAYAYIKDDILAAHETWSARRHASFGFEPREAFRTADGVYVEFKRSK